MCLSTSWLQGTIGNANIQMPFSIKKLGAFYLNYRVQVFPYPKLTQLESEYRRDSQLLSSLYNKRKRWSTPGLQAFPGQAGKPPVPGSLRPQLRRPLFFPRPKLLSFKTLLRSLEGAGLDFSPWPPHLLVYMDFIKLFSLSKLQFPQMRIVTQAGKENWVESPWPRAGHFVKNFAYFFIPLILLSS